MSQYKLNVPTCLHDIWKERKVVNITAALRETDITWKDFNIHWRRKVIAIKKEKDDQKQMEIKQQLVQLLRKAGLHEPKFGTKYSRLAWRVWFINNVVGRAVHEPAATVGSTENPVCL